MIDFRFENICTKIRTGLTSPLPGMDAHIELAPSVRKSDVMNLNHRKKASKGAILILFYEKKSETHLVFMKRTEYKGVHSGQISFPGGKWESTDRSMYHTALRESREEIGILPERVQYFGKLTDLYIPPSNFLVSPFIGVYEGTPTFSPEPKEVAEIIEIPLCFFYKPESLKEIEIMLFEGNTINGMAFEYNSHIIWGATAMILNELLIIMKFRSLGEIVQKK